MTIDEWLKVDKPLNKILLGDCQDLMKEISDKYFELAIVDPPFPKNFIRRTNSDLFGMLCKDNWLETVPDKKYFDELFRISQNQIIWGGNYFTNYLKPTNGWIIWDKKFPKGMKFSPCELAWTSFYNMKKIDIRQSETRKKEYIYWHPCPRPKKLYTECIVEYAKPGDKIIDTHSGSGSLACAAWLEGFDFLAIEKDYDYWKESVERYETEISQLKLF